MEKIFRWQYQKCVLLRLYNVKSLPGAMPDRLLLCCGPTSVYGEDIPLAVSGVVIKLNSILVAFTVGLAHPVSKPPYHSLKVVQ